MMCDNENFGDVAPGKGKGCWCDADEDKEPYEIPAGNVVEKCAEDGERCNCTSIVHFGEAKKDFEEMMMGPSKSKELNHRQRQQGSVMCDSKLFGDIFPGKKKQCFCERQDKPKVKPDHHIHKCGSENETCQCNGRVFFGREFDNKTMSARKAPETPAGHNKYLTFDEMVSFPWDKKQVSGSIDCTVAEFSEVAKGVAKQCYCEAQFAPPKIDRCASEGPDAECVCSGKVYYGLEKVGDQAPAPFDVMIKEPFKVEEAHGSIQCNNYAFGDPAPGKAKQCYCESGVFEPKVQKCSDENGDCSCKGNIFYGAAVIDGAEADFDALLTKNFAYRKSDGKHAMKCNNKQFGDPLPNEPKQCFCDDIGKMNPTQIQSTIDLNNARLMAAQAALDAEKLEAEANAKEARI